MPETDCNVELLAKLADNEGIRILIDKTLLSKLINDLALRTVKC